jgi:hypothetical protein
MPLTKVNGQMLDGAINVDSAGNLSVGTTTALATSSGRGNITINGSSNAILAFGSGGTLRGYVYQDSTTMYLNNSSSGSMNFDTNGAERMRISAAGDVLIQSTSTSISNKGFKINYDAQGPYMYAGVTGTGSWQVLTFARGTDGSLGQVGYIQLNSGSTTYSTTSDYRLKDDVKPMTGALDKVALLKPVTYKWKIDGTDSQGFIAHELQEVVPECVTGVKDEMETYTNDAGKEITRIKPQGIDTSFLVATLTAAIQELKATVDAQAARIAALEAAP